MTDSRSYVHVKGPDDIKSGNLSALTLGSGVRSGSPKTIKGSPRQLGRFSQVSVGSV